MMVNQPVPVKPVVRRKLLILEDDAGILEMYQDLLGKNYDLLKQRSIKEFKNYLEVKPKKKDLLPDLLIVDLHLEDGNFLDFLKRDEAKQIFDIPFLIVSSIEDEDSLNQCFKEGAIDYLVKPFSKNELIIKITRAIEKNSKPDFERKSGFAMDTSLHELKKEGKIIAILTTKEMQIFNLLFKNPGTPIHRDDLIATVWKDTSVTNKSLDVHVFNIRKKIYRSGLKIKFVRPDSYSLFQT